MLINPYQFAPPYDTDAQTYITAVETADGQALETATRYAINNFVIGCKQDGIWSAIKASCILAGARTLAGALVPLVGAAPTNVNFVAGDYNRKTGLVGNGSNKCLDSNRAANADPQNNRHVSVYKTSSDAAVNNKSYIGNLVTAWTFMDYLNGGWRMAISCDSSLAIRSEASTVSGFIGVSRSSSSSISSRLALLTTLHTNLTSSPSSSSSIAVFARRDGAGIQAFVASRLAFYSIGESLDLALLDSRVTTLVNALAAAIP